MTPRDANEVVIRRYCQAWRDGRRVETSRVLDYHVRDGKLAEAWIYDDDQRAVDACLA